MMREYATVKVLLVFKNNEVYMTIKANLLGDIRAEADADMLDVAFYETPDYRTLIESSDRSVVVGRRGTGKSAISYKLNKYWSKIHNSQVLQLAADEDQIIGLRPIIKLFGEEFRYLRAGSRIAWRYALLLEIADVLAKRKYKYSKVTGTELLESHLMFWRKNDYGFSAKIKDRLDNVLDKDKSPEELIGILAQRLQLKDIEDLVGDLLNAFDLDVYILVDRLDEGYEPDNVGIGLVDGIVQAVIDINTKFSRIRPIVFLRDNMFRAISRTDPDFTRNIEGQVLRLHWDEHSLFTLVGTRLNIAFKLDMENTTRIWNRCAARELEGKDGFKKCLRLTLYRPRDILILLNEAFRLAYRQDRSIIIGEDIEGTAKSISNNRLEDLHKEYVSMIPGLSLFTGAFSNSNPDLLIKDVGHLLKKVLESDEHPVDIQQQIAVFGNHFEVIRVLYSIGFIGLYDDSARTFVFCHDGRDPNKEFKVNGRILVHPCYWIALNCSKAFIDPEEAEEIYDEYDIEVSSETPQQRTRRIGKIISELEKIPLGKEGCSDFEDWCLQTIKIVFAGALRNAVLHPNKGATQRRDIVATNLCETRVWKRIYDDYKSRQIIFEVKNYVNLDSDAYRQMLSYCHDQYGKIAFIVCRDTDESIKKHKELDWMKEMFNSHGILIIKLTGKYFCSLLSKLRSPQKHDSPDKAINHLLDTYTRLYLAGGYKINSRK
jgi:hypothetical protein